MKRRIAILGSTGSIGTQTLEVIAQFSERFEVVGLTSLDRLELLEEQVKRFAPRFLGVVQEDLGEEALALFGRHPGLIGQVGDEVNMRLVREFDASRPRIDFEERVQVLLRRSGLGALS